VGQGYAIEIEDRGLGISRARLEEINANLANPPQFDLSGSDRLGLFITGQLAQRHDIKVTIRPSVYGGTTAIVLLPIALVVEEPAIGRAPALPGGQEDGSRYDRLGGRHALTALPAGTGNGSPSTGNGSPSGAGPPARSRSGSGFSFGRLTRPDAGGNEPISGPGADQPLRFPEPTEAGPDQPLRFPEPTEAGPDQPLRFPEPTEAGPDQPPRFAAPTGFGPDQPSRFAASAGDGEGEDSEPTAADLGLPVRVRQANLAPQLRDAPPHAEAGFVSGGFALPGRRPLAAEPAAAPSDDTGRDPDRGAPPTSPEAARDMVSALQRGWQLGRAAAPAPAESETTAEWPKPDETGEAGDG
jgi:hypothetical protein